MFARNLCLCALIGVAAAIPCSGDLPSPDLGPATWRNQDTNSTGLNDVDCQAWQKMFNGMQGERWIFGPNCTATDPCGCRYKVSLPGGVYCYHGRIREIRLSQVSGSSLLHTTPGVLHEAVGDMAALRHLDVPQNFIVGTVPNSIAKLTQLEHFNIAWNYMHGEVPKEINFNRFARGQCNLGGDNFHSESNPSGLNAKTGGNSFGCPLRADEKACESNFFDAAWKSRVMCTYCLPGHGCSEEDCAKYKTSRDLFNHTLGNPNCQACVKGYYAEGGDVTLYDGGGTPNTWAPCKPCAKGSYQNETGQTKCKVCEQGKFQDKEGQGECKACDCPKGTDSPKGTFERCSQGGEGDDPTANCKKCEAGTWGKGGAEACQPCSCTVGKAARATGASEPGDCHCEACGAGHYTLGGNMLCTNMTCLPGWASSVTEAQDKNATCMKCPAMTFGVGGAEQCTNCSKFGKGWHSDAGSATCLPPPTPAPTPVPTPAPTPKPGSKGGIGVGPGIGIGLAAGLALLIANEKRKQRSASAGKAPLLGSSAGLDETGVAIGSAGLYRPPQANPIAPGAPPGATVLDTSNIAKYSIGQQVDNMGNGGAVSGTISAIIPAFGPDAKTGPGKIVVVG